MLFCSLAYLVFFSCVFVVYWTMPWQRARVWLLLAASFSFYASWNHWLACLIAISTAIDFVLARGIELSASERIRKLLLTVNIVGNLSMLCYFKYANFFLESLQTSLRALGADSSIPLLSVILPVGISFYTFEAINYMVDVYRRKIPAERNLANFMLFITFFPHLVAGPIVRARDFLPQITRPKHWDWARLNLGAQFFLLGMFKKLAIADRMAAYADPVFQHPDLYATHDLWFAVLAYTLQVYGDFSGYTDMAIGSAHLLGYKLAQNFNMPFLAADIGELWRRWHISLSTWLRDYLFIPLGGNRGTPWQTARNLIITMTLGGLWHGAEWHLVVWGAMHGCLLVGHRIFHDFMKQWPMWSRLVETQVGTALCVALTFLTFNLTMVPFRAQSLVEAGFIFRRMFGLAASSVALAPAPVHASGLLYTCIIVALSHWVATQVWFKRSVLRVPAPVAGFGYAMQLTLTLILTPASGKAFIYFQF